MSSNQKYFILAWLATLSIVGALGLVLGANPDASGWVFGAPLGALAMWGFARFVERFA